MTNRFNSYHVALADGQRLHLIDEGAGQPLLLMHGFAGTAEGHLDGLIAHLRSSYRVIAPDLRGYGSSQPAARELTPAFYRQDARDMVDLLSLLDLPPVVVLGFSDGAESALLLAAAAPERTRGVVAWGVSGVISSAMLAAVSGWLPVSAWGEARAEWREEIIARHGAHQFPALVEGWVGAARAIHAAGGNICLKEAALIQCPVLLLNGEWDEGNQLDDLHRLAARLPVVTVHQIAASGHAIHREQPEPFRRLVDAFLGELAHGAQEPDARAQKPEGGDRRPETENGDDCAHYGNGHGALP